MSDHVLFGLAAAVHLFAGLDVVTYHATVKLDAMNQTFSYEERTFYYKAVMHYPLSYMERAIVTRGSTYNFLFAILVAHNGPKVNFGDGPNSRDNNDEAAEAVNAFVARYATSSDPADAGASADPAGGPQSPRRFPGDTAN